MKKIGLLLLIVLLSLCSCVAQSDGGKPSEQPRDAASAEYIDTLSDESLEQSAAPNEDLPNYIEGENENIGKFGGKYTFDYHYAQTPDSFFYIKLFVSGNEGNGVVRFSKANFNDKTLIASAEDFNADNSRFNAQIVGVSSKWLFVAVTTPAQAETNERLLNVYKLAHNGSTNEKLVENVRSVYVHPGNGNMYFTQYGVDSILHLYSLDFTTGATTQVDTGECTPNGSYWCQLKDGKIGLLDYPNVIVVDSNGSIDVSTEAHDEKVPMCLGRDLALKETVEGYIADGNILFSYAEWNNHIYYIEGTSAQIKDNTLYRIRKDGTDKTVLKEDTDIIALYSYNGVLYGDITDGDVACLVIVSDTGEATKTDAVTGIGQWGYIRIEDGLFIRTYEVVPNSPALVYVYNPLTGQAVSP